MSSYDANGDDYVSAYLLRPLRSIEEVLEAREFRGAVAAGMDPYPKSLGGPLAGGSNDRTPLALCLEAQPVSSPAYRTTKLSTARSE